MLKEIPAMNFQSKGASYLCVLIVCFAISSTRAYQTNEKWRCAHDELVAKANVSCLSCALLNKVERVFVVIYRWRTKWESQWNLWKAYKSKKTNSNRFACIWSVTDLCINSKFISLKQSSLQRIKAILVYIQYCTHTLSSSIPAPKECQYSKLPSPKLYPNKSCTSLYCNSFFHSSIKIWNTSKYAKYANSMSNFKFLLDHLAKPYS